MGYANNNFGAGWLYRLATTEKVAGPVSEIGSVVNPLNLYGGATLGGLAALVTPTRSLQQQAEFDSRDGALRALTNVLIPGVGAYREFKRVGAGIRSPEMKAIKAQQLQDKAQRELAALQQAHGAADAGAKAAGWKSEMAGIMLNPLNMFGGNILGTGAAALTPTRTLDEQAAADNTIASNLLVPGVASHNHWKRIGAATRSPEMLAMRRKATIDRLQRQAGGGGNAKEEEVAPQETAKEDTKAAASEWKAVDLAKNPINWSRTLPKPDASAKNWQGSDGSARSWQGSKEQPAAPPMKPVAPPMVPVGATKTSARGDQSQRVENSTAFKSTLGKHSAPPHAGNYANSGALRRVSGKSTEDHKDQVRNYARVIRRYDNENKNSEKTSACEFGAKVAFNISDLTKNIPEGLKKVMPAAGVGALGGAALAKGLMGKKKPAEEEDTKVAARQPTDSRLSFRTGTPGSLSFTGKKTPLPPKKEEKKEEAKSAGLRNFGAKFAGFNIGDLKQHLPAAGVGALGGAALGGLAGLINPGQEDIYDDDGNVVGRQRRGRFGAALRGALGGGAAGGLAGAGMSAFAPDMTKAIAGRAQGLYGLGKHKMLEMQGKAPSYSAVDQARPMPASISGMA